MQNNRWNLLEWLCINPTLLKSKSFGGFVTFLLILMILFLAVPVLFQFTIAVLGIAKFETIDARYDAMRNTGLLVAALFGVPFIVWRSIVAQKQVDISEQGNITDRLNKAIEGLGTERTVKQIVKTPRYKRHNDEWLRDEEGKLVPAIRPDGTEIVDRESIERTEPNLEVRIGSIYALERIAQDSPRDHIQIMEILCAYARENAPATSLEPTESLLERARPRTDIQTVVTVIGRRSMEQLKNESEKQFRLDLGNTDLSGVDFQGTNFAACQFHKCRLEAANFSNCELTGTQFYGALLNYSDFVDANLFGTKFDYAVMNRPTIHPGVMSRSITMAKIYGISIASANITAINYLGEPQKQNLVFGSADTKLHHELEFSRKKYDKELHQIRKLKNSGEVEQARKRSSELYENGFVDWCPYDHEDMSFGSYYGWFLDRLKIRYWPIVD